MNGSVWPLFGMLWGAIAAISLLSIRIAKRPVTFSFESYLEMHFYLTNSHSIIEEYNNSTSSNNNNGQSKLKWLNFLLFDDIHDINIEIIVEHRSSTVFLFLKTAAHFRCHDFLTWFSFSLAVAFMHYFPFILRSTLLLLFSFCFVLFFHLLLY